MQAKQGPAQKTHAAISRRVWMGAAIVLCIALLSAAAVWTLTHNDNTNATVSDAELWEVKRGDLKITVDEGGTLQAETVVRIRSRVQGNNTIIYLVPEGTVITPEDVASEKVLVELDSSALKERYTKQEISYQNASAAYTRAREDFEIQQKQNESDIKSAELALKFAHLELQQYLGENLAGTIAEETAFQKLGALEHLGGTALKTKTELQSNVSLAEEEVQRAKDRVTWTEKLFGNKYVTRNEVTADQLALKRKEAELQQANMDLKLFLRYQLPKQAESRHADVEEARRELDRVRARAKSEEAQASAKLKSAEATYNLEKEQLADLGRQIENCVIKATQPGLVVYASSTNYWRRSRNPIEEGTSVREREEIIHLPDLKTMIAEVKLHETTVQKVEPGQSAVITVDAYPDLRLKGTVQEVASLPDPQHWLQDVQVYTCVIAIDGSHPSLKPGMSCRTAITIREMMDTLYVPVQAVVGRGQERLCFLQTPSGTEERPVQLAGFDDRFAAITQGLKAGDRVIVNPSWTESAPSDALDTPAEDSSAPADQTERS
ncbi:MAG: HlyD family efflux transporter periplasmic adaptor subunit [Candidatus Pacebacteria bacterium]|nr:HlyD family efflux transporter periplasmic adaptor subunit [Candidatus Paceibacterota bacterium]